MKKSEKVVLEMKDTDLKERFIEMRAGGDSYDKIAKELNKSKTTLILWNRELFKEIGNLEFLHYKALLEKHKLTQKAKIEFFVEEIEKISLKNHPIYSEKQVQGKINEDPSILGLGELIVKHKERIQPTAGRLNLLLQSPDTNDRI